MGSSARPRASVTGKRHASNPSSTAPLFSRRSRDLFRPVSLASVLFIAAVLFLLANYLLQLFLPTPPPTAPVPIDHLQRAQTPHDDLPASEFPSGALEQGSIAFNEEIVEGKPRPVPLPPDGAPVLAGAAVDAQLTVSGQENQNENQMDQASRDNEHHYHDGIDEHLGDNDEREDANINLDDGEEDEGDRDHIDVVGNNDDDMAKVGLNDVGISDTDVDETGNNIGVDENPRDELKSDDAAITGLDMEKETKGDEDRDRIRDEGFNGDNEFPQEETTREEASRVNDTVLGGGEEDKESGTVDAEGLRELRASMDDNDTVSEQQEVLKLDDEKAALDADTVGEMGINTGAREGEIDEEKGDVKVGSHEMGKEEVRMELNSKGNDVDDIGTGADGADDDGTGVDGGDDVGTRADKVDDVDARGGGEVDDVSTMGDGSDGSGSGGDGDDGLNKANSGSNEDVGDEIETGIGIGADTDVSELDGNSVVLDGGNNEEANLDGGDGSTQGNGSAENNDLKTYEDWHTPFQPIKDTKRMITMKELTFNFGIVPANVTLLRRETIEMMKDYDIREDDDYKSLVEGGELENHINWYGKVIKEGWGGVLAGTNEVVDGLYHVRHSGDEKKGYATYASERLPKGTILGGYGGELVDLDTIESGQYAWETPKMNLMKNGEALNVTMVVDGTRIGNLMRFLNDLGEKSNVEVFWVPIDGRWHGVYETSKDAEKGEELGVSYGENYWGDEGLPEENDDETQESEEDKVRIDNEEIGEEENQGKRKVVLRKMYLNENEVERIGSVRRLR